MYMFLNWKVVNWEHNQMVGDYNYYERAFQRRFDEMEKCSN